MNAGYLSVIKSLEGFTPIAQWDYAQHTNGYGTKAGFAGEKIDKSEADRRFSKELREARSLVDAFSPRIDEGTAAALTSLTFNAGAAWMKGGLGHAVLAGDLNSIRHAFLQYDKAGGHVLAGLSHRRSVEAAWIGQPVPMCADELTAKPDPINQSANEDTAVAAPTAVAILPAARALPAIAPMDQCSKHLNTRSQATRSSSAASLAPDLEHFPAEVAPRFGVDAQHRSATTKMGHNTVPDQRFDSLGMERPLAPSPAVQEPSLVTMVKFAHLRWMLTRLGG